MTVVAALWGSRRVEVVERWRKARSRELEKTKSISWPRRIQFTEFSQSAPDNQPSRSSIATLESGLVLGFLCLDVAQPCAVPMLCCAQLNLTTASNRLIESMLCSLRTNFRIAVLEKSSLNAESKLFSCSEVLWQLESLIWRTARRNNKHDMRSVHLQDPVICQPCSESDK